VCGVFGYVTDRDTALGPILVEAAERLTYRGYDSVGAATFRDGTIDLRKDVGRVDAVPRLRTDRSVPGDRSPATRPAGTP
jgi:glucosamine--fructose-6-phosphate aminotransferase (isomerizing)